MQFFRAYVAGILPFTLAGEMF